MYLHLYKSNPTAGATDGSLVSEGDGSNPITIGPLNSATNNESAALTLAIRCDAGYQTAAETTITPTGTTAAKWALSADGVAWQAYGAALTLPSGIDATNTIFYAKAKVTEGEPAANDTSVSLVVECESIAAV